MCGGGDEGKPRGEDDRLRGLSGRSRKVTSYSSPLLRACVTLEERARKTAVRRNTIYVYQASRATDAGRGGVAHVGHMNVHLHQRRMARDADGGDGKQRGTPTGAGLSAVSAAAAAERDTGYIKYDSLCGVNLFVTPHSTRCTCRVPRTVMTLALSTPWPFCDDVCVRHSAR
jgi:hypothetical protein